MSYTYQTETMDAQDCLQAAFASKNSSEFVSGFVLERDGRQELVITTRQPVKVQHNKHFNPVVTLG